MWLASIRVVCFFFLFFFYVGLWICRTELCVFICMRHEFFFFFSIWLGCGIKLCVIEMVVAVELNCVFLIWYVLIIVLLKKIS